MVFDVDKLKEAIAFYGDADSYAGLEQAVLQAARLVVAGQPLWWCEKHNGQGVPRLSTDPFTCWKAEFTKHLDPQDCRMVEGWWMPTGGGE